MHCVLFLNHHKIIKDKHSFDTSIADEYILSYFITIIIIFFPVHIMIVLCLIYTLILILIYPYNICSWKDKSNFFLLTQVKMNCC